MNWEILNNYIQGNCTEEELRVLGEWLQENRANEDFFKTFIEQWNSEDEDLSFDARKAWEHFKQNRLSHNSEANISSEVTAAPTNLAKDNAGRKRSRMYWYLSAAATLILLIGLFFITQYSIAPSEQNELVVQEIVTDKGEKSTLKLSDGSRIILNSESKLEIPDNYNKEGRTLYLEGEAFFEVKHDDEHSFEVVTSKGYVKNLGTQFNIAAYDSNKIEVAVKEGLVSIGEVINREPQKDIRKLGPNEVAVLTHQEELLVSNIEDINTYIGWTEDKLVFNGKPFSEVAERLERLYGIEIIIQDRHLAQRTLSATYDNMTIEEVLNVLSASLQMTYERDGKTVTFQDRSISN